MATAQQGAASGRYSCPSCSRTFDGEHALKVHVGRIHGAKRKRGRKRKAKKRVGRPPKAAKRKVGRPKKRVGRPKKRVGRPRKKVGRPRKKVGRPRKKVGRPRKKVGRPKKAVRRAGRPAGPGNLSALSDNQLAALKTAIRREVSRRIKSLQNIGR